MKKLMAAVLSVFIILALSGCGSDGGGNPPPLFVADIVSDPRYDGDIRYDSQTNSYTVTQGYTGSVLAGIDPINTALEYRSFLAFNLTGAGGVPGDAIIDSAWLDIYINRVATQFPLDTIPLRIDLVSFEPPTLVIDDYDSSKLIALKTMIVNPPISRADAGQHISIDVTPLMVEAQRLGLLYFQVRIMEDLGIVDPGVVEINDTTGVDRATFAPLLSVTYY